MKIYQHRHSQLEGVDTYGFVVFPKSRARRVHFHFERVFVPNMKFDGEIEKKKERSTVNTDVSRKESYKAFSEASKKTAVSVSV